MSDFDPEWHKKYERKRGKKGPKGLKQRKITFSWVSLDINQGQSIKYWEDNGLLSKLCDMMRQVGQYPASDALAISQMNLQNICKKKMKFCNALLCVGVVAFCKFQNNSGSGVFVKSHLVSLNY